MKYWPHVKTLTGSIAALGIADDIMDLAAEDMANRAAALPAPLRERAYEAGKSLDDARLALEKAGNLILEIRDSLLGQSENQGDTLVPGNT